MRRPFHAAVALASALLVSMLLLAVPSSSQTPAASGSAPATAAARGAPIARALEKLGATIAGYGGKLGASIVDVQTGEVLAARGDRDPLNPASNMKLLTAAAALWHLGASHQYRTALYGKRNGAVVEDLVLRGHGDPSLGTRDLWAMAAELRRSGVRRAQGDIVVDQSFFDGSFVPPGFEQQPDEWAYFRAPVAALSLGRNTVAMSVYPTSKDQAATVAFDPAGVVDVTGTVKTGERGTAQDVTLSLSPVGPRLAARVGGSIPADSHPLVAVKRVDDPGLLAGLAFKALLADQGIVAGGSVRFGTDRPRSLLVSHRSARLGELVHELGKNSDNFYAEMVFKSLAGKDKSRGLSSADGAEVVLRYLKHVGAADEGTVVKNGSGLFDANRVTANTLTRVLRAAYLDPAFGSEYVAHLAVGGVDGTLHGRFRNMRKARLVRAKTGTLSDIVALSGYVLSPSGGAPVAFAFVVNNVSGKVTGARAAVDKCVQAVVRAHTRAKAGADEPD